MKTTYDQVTKADGSAARDRLLAKARLVDPPLRDIAKMHRRWRPKVKADEWQTLVEDTTADQDCFSVLPIGEIGASAVGRARGGSEREKH